MYWACAKGVEGLVVGTIGQRVIQRRLGPLYVRVEGRVDVMTDEGRRLYAFANRHPLHYVIPGRHILTQPLWK
jgi:hypothetical protein